MTGRREQQKEARKRRILSAATHLFTKRGYAATAIGDIARRARLAVGTLYNYFPSKPEIAMAIVRAQTGEALSRGEEVIKRPRGNADDAIAALLDIYIDTFAHFERDLWREIMAGAMTDPAGLGASFFAQDARLIQQLDALLQELQHRGALAPDAATGRGAITLYGVYVTWFMAYLGSDAVDLDTFRAQVREGISVVMNGLLHPAEPR